MTSSRATAKLRGRDYGAAQHDSVGDDTTGHEIGHTRLPREYEIRQLERRHRAFDGKLGGGARDAGAGQLRPHPEGDLGFHRQIDESCTRDAPQERLVRVRDAR
jgi:hypothetical protein